jgi:hypothetical protein
MTLSRSRDIAKDATELTPEIFKRMPQPDPKEGDKKARGDLIVVAGKRDLP